MKNFKIVNFVNVFIYIFILAPLLVVIISSFNTAEYLVFPPQGFTFDWYNEVISKGRYTEPFWNSIKLAVVTTMITLPVGTMIAYAISRYKSRFNDLLQSFFLSPLVIPTLLLGIGLLILVSNLGVQMYFPRLLLAHVVIVIPYVVRTMIAGFAGMDKSIEQASIILGASPIKTFFLVTVPLARPALLASGFLSLVVSFDELIIALFLTGPGFNTLPMTIYSDVQFNLSTSLAAISSLIIFGTVLLGLLAVLLMGVNKKS